MACVSLPEGVWLFLTSLITYRQSSSSSIIIIIIYYIMSPSSSKNIGQKPEAEQVFKLVDGKTQRRVGTWISGRARFESKS